MLLRKNSTKNETQHLPFASEKSVRLFQERIKGFGRKGCGCWKYWMKEYRKDPKCVVSFLKWLEVKPV